jgi:hypothetical protein
MGLNGHVAVKKQAFGTGIQVVDQNGEFKYGSMLDCYAR